MSTDCLFCKIVAGTIPASTVFENADVIAFNDISPQAPTHVLVIPKMHTAKLAETTHPTLLGQVLDGVRQTAAQLGLKDFRVVFNNGEAAGQTVFHLHAHLLAGRTFAWPPG